MAHPPVVSAGTTLGATVAHVPVAAHPPTVMALSGTVVGAPVASVSVTAHPPMVLTAATITPPAATVRVTAAAPYVRVGPARQLISIKATLTPPRYGASLAETRWKATLL